MSLLKVEILQHDRTNLHSGGREQGADPLRKRRMRAGWDPSDLELDLNPVIWNWN